MRSYFILLALSLLVGCAQQAQRPLDVPISRPGLDFQAEQTQACVSLYGVGDIMLGGTAKPILNEKGYDYPFDALRSELQSADIAIGNLETALTHRGEPFEKKYNFRNPPEKVIPALQAAGFDIVGLANNHTVDYGEQGLADTLNALKAAGLPAVGAGMSLGEARRYELIERNGYKVAFLAYSLTFPKEFWASHDRMGTAYGRKEHVEKDVAAAKNEADAVIVSFHWGREGTTELRDYQKTIGRAAIDAGASVVLGHHPHILQGVERYKEGVIFYSLGNFAFGSYSNRVQTGGAAKVELCDGRLAAVELHILDTNNFRVHFQPTQAMGELLKTSQVELQKLAKVLETDVRLSNKGVVIVERGEN